MHTRTFLSSAINKSFHWLRLTFLHWHHTHTVASKLNITRALKQNRNMATSTLPRLWTSPAFAFETLMKKSFKDHTPSLQRRLRVASTVLAEKKFKMCIGFLVRSIISKTAMNSHYFWPCCLVSWGKRRKWLCSCLFTKRKLLLFDSSAVFQKSILILDSFLFALGLHAAGPVFLKLPLTPSNHQIRSSIKPDVLW